jgi:shikimate dehydrogenase
MNSWFAQRNIACATLPLHLSETGLRSALQLVRHSENVQGAIVTIPFKREVASYLEELSEASLVLDAVNVIRKTADGCLFGDMLDGEAMLCALRARRISIRGRRVFVAGCGGAGSAMAFSACIAGAGRVRLMDVDDSCAEKLAAALLKRFPNCDIRTTASPGDSDVLINATPLGMNADDDIPIGLTNAADTLVVDAVTSLTDTPWVRACKARGWATIGGNELAAAQLPLLLAFFGHPSSPLSIISAH